MTRAVTDILYRTDGTAWASAPVTFERTAGSFDDGSSWPPDEKQVTTDATGAYSVHLWPDAAGSIRSRYHVTYPNGDVFYVSIPDGTTPITMPEIRVAAVAPPVPPSALDAHVAAPDPHAGYLLPAEADLRYAALVHSQPWSTITGTPTTLGGYGITDAFSQAAADLRYAPIVHSQAWSTISGTPTTLLGYGITDAYTKGQVDTALGGKANAATTLAGYGITDAYTKTAGDARYAPIAHNQAWSTITGTPTTVAGYGILDVYTQTQSNANLALKANLTGGNALTGAQIVTSDAIGTRPLTLKGFSGQTGNFFEVQNSTAGVLASIDSAGKLGIGITPTRALHVLSGSANMARFESPSAAYATVEVSNTSTGGRIWGLVSGGQTPAGFDTPTGSFSLRDVTAGATRLTVDLQGNFGLNTLNQFGAGQRVIGIANAATVPSTNPTGGGVIYCEAGALKYRGSSGTVTQLGAA